LVFATSAVLVSTLYSASPEASMASGIGGQEVAVMPEMALLVKASNGQNGP